MKQFDLAALLRLTSKNWYRLRKILFLSDSEYTCLQEMFQVRNSWAHMNTRLPEIEVIQADIEIITNFMTQVKCSNEAIKEARDYSVQLSH